VAWVQATITKPDNTTLQPISLTQTAGTAGAYTVTCSVPGNATLSAQTYSVVVSAASAAGNVANSSPMTFLVPSAAALLAWAVAQAGPVSPLPAVAVTALGVLLYAGALAPQLPVALALATGRLAPLPGAYAGVFAAPGEAVELAKVDAALRGAPAGRDVYVFPVDAGLYFMARRTGAGRHAQFVHRFTSEELAAEAARVAADRPAVVVARVAGPDETIGYTRWASYGSPVLERARAGLRESLRTTDFIVYEEVR
jgi:hypothetical protein